MPEAAEVELVKRGLDQALPKETTLNRVDVFDQKIHFKEDLPVKVSGVRRKGKLIGIDLEDKTIAMHLRLAGRIVIGYDENARAILHFKNDQPILISFADPRRFATMSVVDKNDFGKDLGIDLLTGNIDLWQPPNSKRAVKTVMLDQKEIAGIGNYLIDEALWMNKINPKRPFNDLGEQDVKQIAYSAREVAKKALRAGGMSVKDYVDLFGKEGSFQDSLNAYGRSGRDCYRCGRSLEKTTVGGRGTTYCSFCQH
jgi:formamidopyrimidine-DNA glycosylase